MYQILNNQIIYTITPDESGVPLRNILRRLHLSKAALHRFKANNAILVNGCPRRADQLVYAGEKLCINLTDPYKCLLSVAPGQLEIIYEDEAVLCVNKPPGIAVHPSPGHQHDTLANQLAGHLPGKSIHLLNRLDKDTSGIVLVAKNAFYKQRFCRDSRPVVKKYLAIVAGEFPKKAGEINLPIARRLPGQPERCIRQDGQNARTSYQLIHPHAQYSALAVTLHTGRTHQIRVHLAFLGHPVLGDKIYGRATSWINRQALHAWKITFHHPASNQIIELCAPIPPDIATLYQPVAEYCAYQIP